MDIEPEYWLGSDVMYLSDLSDLFLTSNRDLITKSVDKNILPILDSRPLGCGGEGCVYKTKSDDVVLKITEEKSEIEFAIAVMSYDKYPTGVVRYHQIISFPRIKRYKMYGLWRDSAYDIGDIGVDEDHPFIKVLYSCRDIWRIILIRREDAIDENKRLSKTWVNRLIREYIQHTKTDVGEFNSILQALGWCAKNGIILTDVRAGNMGKIKIGNKYIWSITDTGGALFLDNRYKKMFNEFGLRGLIPVLDD